MITASPEGAESAQSASNLRRHRCFKVAKPLPSLPCAVSLDETAAKALAGLLPLLGCGEEAAIAGFDQMASDGDLTTASRAALGKIAEDERVHDALLRGLRMALPETAPDPAQARALRRFHLQLPAGGTATHLARIAGVDAAVCTILSRVLRPGAALARDLGVVSVLSYIRRDETRHVAVSRSIAMAAANCRRSRDAAAEARTGLADLLTVGAPGFERLGIDPGRLDQDIRRLPDGLFPR